MSRYGQMTPEQRLAHRETCRRYYQQYRDMWLSGGKYAEHRARKRGGRTGARSKVTPFPIEGAEG